MRLLRECADLIALILCSIFNRCIVSGAFPDDCKCSIVTTLFPGSLSRSVGRVGENPGNEVAIIFPLFDDLNKLTIVQSPSFL